MATTTDENRDELVASTPDALRDQAIRSLRKRRDLRAHAVVYGLVNLAVWAVWLVIAANTHGWWPWPIFLTVFWGIGLAMNAWDVYFRKPITEQEIQHEMHRMGQSR